MGEAFATCLMDSLATRIISKTDRVKLKDARLPFREVAAVTYYSGFGTFIHFVRRGVRKD